MGWASGSCLMDDVIQGLKKKLPPDVRREVYKVLIPAFEDSDCDTLMECFDSDKAFVEAYCEVNPREAGYQAAAGGAPRSANPHSPRSKAGREWLYGWEEHQAWLEDFGDGEP